MTAMSDFETRANNIQKALSGAYDQVKDFGYSSDPIEETMSKVSGMFVIWLTSCEEARHQLVDPKASFPKSVIDRLPEQDDASWKKYIQPTLDSSLKERAQALWGIRITYTHGDGDISLVTNSKNLVFINNVPNILNGVNIVNGRLILKGFDYHVAIRTMVQIRDVLP